MANSLGSKYARQEVLDRGAMGQVFAGSIRPTGEPVAIKVLKPELVSDPEVVARLSYGTWSHDGSVAGQLGCGVEANGLLRIVWIVDDNQIGIITEGSDHQALYNWWKSNACAVPTAC